MCFSGEWMAEICSGDWGLTGFKILELCHPASMFLNVDFIIIYFSYLNLHLILSFLKLLAFVY